MRPLFVFVVLLGLAFATEDLKCPRVYDGLTNGHFDLSTQFSSNSMSANWVGLSSDEVLTYDCAIISESSLRARDSSCRAVQGFPGIPDIKNWVNVRKENSVTFTNLKLTPENKYVVVLRTTLKNGAHVYSNSDGILVLPQELSLEGSGKQRSEEPERVRNVQTRAVSDGELCPIDEANRCRAGQVSVQDFLNEFYGPPRFPADDFFLFGIAAAAAGDDDDDDDDDNSGGIIGGVVGGVLLLCCLCLLLLALLSFLLGAKGGEEPFSERIVERKQEHVDADLGSSVEHQIADTRVEFPDIDPHSRLSQA